MQSISILIPTQGRLTQLQRLLDGLVAVDDRERIPHEIIVVNNARDLDSATAVEKMVQNLVRKNRVVGCTCGSWNQESPAP